MGIQTLTEIKGDDRGLLNPHDPFDRLTARIAREVFVTDWGEFEIPADVPRHFRKDGWFDRRYKRSVAQVRAYFKRQEENLRDAKPIQSYQDWLAA